MIACFVSSPVFDGRLEVFPHFHYRDPSGLLG